ncbi:MAG: hypothetical protein GC153_13465 [Alphaproteobacteria bacterium]|nr:hypothetical protein [Alphaproteobacteria bacterium]
MPSDVEAPQKVAPPPPKRGAGARLRRFLRPLRPALRPFRPIDAARRRFLEYLSVDMKRRRRSSTALSIALNIVFFTLLTIFGRFEIWIPSTPGDFINVTMVTLPPAPEPPAPKVIPEPEPEPVEKPKLKPEPVPAPKPKPKEAPKPAPPKPEPEKTKPLIDLTPKPVFAPPADEIAAPTTGAPAAPAAAPEPLEIRPAPAAAQSPTETERPLSEPEPQPDIASGLDVAPDIKDEKQADAAAGEEEAQKKKAPPAPSGDDQFDANPFGPSPSRLALPKVDLPEGEKSDGGGKSGVVAIFCPEQFKNKDKAAECAGRTQILSGWKPGSSGEDWSQAISVLKAERAAGKTGPDLDKVVGPDVARRMLDDQRARALEDPRRGLADSPAVPSDSNLTGGWGRPDIGPKPLQPNWTLREDPLVTDKDVRKLGKALDAANAAKQAAPEAEDAKKKDDRPDKKD